MDEDVKAGETVVDWWGINYYSRPVGLDGLDEFGMGLEWVCMGLDQLIQQTSGFGMGKLKGKSGGCRKHNFWTARVTLNKIIYS